MVNGPAASVVFYVGCSFLKNKKVTKVKKMALPDQIFTIPAITQANAQASLLKFMKLIRMWTNSFLSKTAHAPS